MGDEHPHQNTHTAPHAALSAAPVHNSVLIRRMTGRIKSQSLPAARRQGAGWDEEMCAEITAAAGVPVGINPIVTFEKQRLNMIGNMVYSGLAVLKSDSRILFQVPAIGTSPAVLQARAIGS